MRLNDLTADQIMALKKEAKMEYIRVGCDYFKLIKKPDRFGVFRNQLKKWNKEEIKLDLGNRALYDIPKYNDFILDPDNTGNTKIKHGCYNMYATFEHKPRYGDFEWSLKIMEHIFGEQVELGFRYMKVMYENPRRMLPILALVSTERSTGKTTFLDWLNIIFGANMVMIEPDVIGSTFNAEYAAANIIGIDETVIDRQVAVEKIKSLATKKNISVNMKNVSQFTLPFFGKIVMASNNEEKFMKIESQEIRFWVRKIGFPKYENHNIIEDLQREIPAFLYHLAELPEVDFTKSRMVFTGEELENETLLKVKKASKTWLYKELGELMDDYFNNSTKPFVYMRPKDVKDRFFSHNNLVQISYIRSVLKNEYEIDPEKMGHYSLDETLNDSSFKGCPFKFTSELIGIIQEVEQIEKMPF